MSRALDSLLGRRMLLVTGKGGTGKTTVAAALGMLAARKGVDTVVAEVGRESALPHLLVRDAPRRAQEPDRDPIQLAPHLYTLRVVPEIAFEEFLGLQLRVAPLARGLVRNAGFRRFLDAAPGWRELITLGKLWHLHTLEDAGRPRFRLLIVDAPATGHGLSLLSVPQVILGTVRMGPLRRHTERVQDFLRDPARTLALPVTLPEELPVRETLELCQRIRELGLHAGPPIANGVEHVPPGIPPEALRGAVDRLVSHNDPPPLAHPRALASALDHRLRRAALHAEFLAKLDTDLERPHAELPYLADSVDEPEGIEQLADALEQKLDAWTEAV